MKLIKCGSEVELKASKIIGEITAISIRFNAVIYKVQFFSNGEFKTVWVDESQIAGDFKHETIGFR